MQGDRRPGRYGEQVQSFHQHHSDEEEEDEEGFARGRRRGPSVDEFLRGSELGRLVREVGMHWEFSVENLYCVSPCQCECVHVHVGVKHASILCLCLCVC